MVFPSHLQKSISVVNLAFYIRFIGAAIGCVAIAATTSQLKEWWIVAAAVVIAVMKQPSKN